MHLTLSRPLLMLPELVSQLLWAGAKALQVPGHLGTQPGAYIVKTTLSF